MDIKTLEGYREMHGAETADELLAAFNRVAHNLGFIGLAIGIDFVTKDNSMIANQSFITLPTAWTEEYLSNNYQSRDPLIHWCAKFAYPTTWRRVRKWAEDKYVFEQAERYGLVDGVAIAVGIHKQGMAIISGGAAREVDNPMFSAFTKMARFAGTKLYLLSRQLPIPKADDIPFDEIDMTIMSMILAGHTMHDMEQATGISRQAINAREQKHRRLTGTSTKNGPALTLHWLDLL